MEMPPPTLTADSGSGSPAADGHEPCDIFTYLPRTRPGGRPTRPTAIRTASLQAARNAARNAGFLNGAPTVTVEYADGAFLEADTALVRRVRSAERQLGDYAPSGSRDGCSDAATLQRIVCSGTECISETVRRLLADGADSRTANEWGNAARVLAGSVVIHEMRR